MDSLKIFWILFLIVSAITLWRSPEKIRKRLLASIITLIGAIFLVLVLINSGALADPTITEKGGLAKQEELKSRYMLDKPMWERMLLQTKGMFWDGFLPSESEAINVVAEFWHRFPSTIELALAAMIIAIIVGMSFGIIAALRPKSFLDYGLMGLAVLGLSIPVFLLAQAMVDIFSTSLGWFDSGGWRKASDGIEAYTGFLLIDCLLNGDIKMFFTAIGRLILPAFALATIPLAIIARMTRASILDVLQEDYIRTAHAKGLSHTRVILVHTLRNALIPVVTVIGLQMGALFAGAVLTETVFSWPGIGTWIFQGIQDGHPHVILVGVTHVVIVFIAVNIAVDLAYSKINPQARESQAQRDS